MNQKKQLGILFLIWLIVQGALFYKYGIDATQESLKYIGAAKTLLAQGHLPETRYFFYLSTTLLIVFCLKTGLGYGGVVFFQLLLNLYATWAFFNALKSRETKRHSAFFTTLLLIFFLPYQTFNFYLYTESIFYSSALLFFSSCLRYCEPSRRVLLTQALFLCLTILSRPLGIIFLPCWVFFLAWKHSVRPLVILLSFALALVLGVVVVNTIMTTIGDWQILKPAEYGYIICDIPTRSKLELDYLKSHSPLMQLGYFVWEYPAEALRLTARRLQAFFLLSRSYYSKGHNLFLLFYAAVLTLPFLYSLFSAKRMFPDKPLFYLCLSIVLGFAFAIALQCDDYSNRFHHTIVPVFLFGGAFLLLEKRRVAKPPNG